ncbi:MAG: Maf family protein [Pseudohongiellaceae bacterium]
MADVPLYLASASPRRKDLLDQLGLACTVLPQDIDESRLPSELPADYVMRLARQKAEAALQSVDTIVGACCLGSDTTVVCDNEIFEKPVDARDARRMLGALSGTTHQVLTAVALASTSGTEVFLSTSDVTFRSLTSAEIDAYWRTGEPADKAGAYGIQGLAAMFVTHISGSYSGIMGLPVAETIALLNGAGITTLDILEQHATTQI